MDIATPESYNATADELASRILALIPDNRSILTLDSVWDLLRVPGFKCDDLRPSLFQAGWALSRARQLWRERHPEDSDA